MFLLPKYSPCPWDDPSINATLDVRHSEPNDKNTKNAPQRNVKFVAGAGRGSVHIRDIRIEIISPIFWIAESNHSASVIWWLVILLI